MRLYNGFTTVGPVQQWFATTTHLLYPPSLSCVTVMPTESDVLKNFNDRLTRKNPAVFSRGFFSFLSIGNVAL